MSDDTRSRATEMLSARLRALADHYQQRSEVELRLLAIALGECARDAKALEDALVCAMRHDKGAKA